MTKRKDGGAALKIYVSPHDPKVRWREWPIRLLLKLYGLTGYTLMDDGDLVIGYKPQHKDLAYRLALLAHDYEREKAGE